MHLYIFRHGMTFFAKNNLPYGDKVETAEILPEAIPVTKRLGRYLMDIPTAKNYTSPFLRCVQTSNIVTEISGKKFEKVEDLRDWDPRRETVEEMIKRILVFSKELDAKRYSSISICTHGYPINALIAYFTKGEIKKDDLDNFPNPGVLVSIKNKKASYQDFNDK